MQLLVLSGVDYSLPSKTGWRAMPFPAEVFHKMHSCRDISSDHKNP
jgi:hypothetical protein